MTCGDKRVIQLGTHAEVTVVCYVEAVDHGRRHQAVDRHDDGVVVVYTWPVS
jgi:hypothetical protein